MGLLVSQIVRVESISSRIYGPSRQTRCDWDLFTTLLMNKRNLKIKNKKKKQNWEMARGLARRLSRRSIVRLHLSDLPEHVFISRFITFILDYNDLQFTYGGKRWLIYWRSNLHGIKQNRSFQASSLRFRYPWREETIDDRWRDWWYPMKRCSNRLLVASTTRVAKKQPLNSCKTVYFTSKFSLRNHFKS